MKMINIKKALESGAWFRYEGSYDYNYTRIEDCSFRIQIVDFSKIGLSDIDDPQDVSPMLDMDANHLYLLKVNFVSLCRYQLSASAVRENLRVVDGDGFEFRVLKDSHLVAFSAFGQGLGLEHFYYTSFDPKIKYSGAWLFLLPNEEMVEYCLSMEGGDFVEV